MFHILTLLLLAAIAIAIVLFLLPRLTKTTSTSVNTPTPAPTAQNRPRLQSYTNKIGFSLKFLSTYAIIPDSEEDFSKRNSADFRKNFTGYVGYEPPQILEALMIVPVGATKPGQFDRVPFSIWVFNNPDDLSINQWFQRYWYYPFLWGVFSEPDKSHVLPTDSAPIDNHPAKSVVVAYQPNSPQFLYTASGDKMFLIKLIKSDVTDPIPGQILGSLKF